MRVSYLSIYIALELILRNACSIEAQSFRGAASNKTTAKASSQVIDISETTKKIGEVVSFITSRLLGKGNRSNHNWQKNGGDRNWEDRERPRVDRDGEDDSDQQGWNKHVNKGRGKFQKESTTPPETTKPPVIEAATVHPESTKPPVIIAAATVATSRRSEPYN